jgi:hypothetical protein
MTQTDVMKILSKIDYKPGFRIHCMKHADANKLYVRIQFHCLDARDPDKTVTLTHNGDFKDAMWWSQDADETTIIALVKRNIHRMERHEVNEFLRFRDHHVTAPHDEHACYCRTCDPDKKNSVFKRLWRWLRTLWRHAIMEP